MRLKRVLLPALCLVGAALVALPIVHAAGSFGLDEAAAGTGLKKTEILATIGSLIKTVLSYLGVLFLILMLYAGFLYMTAQGDSKKTESALGIIKSAVIGLVIIAASYALTAFVINAVTEVGSGQEAGAPSAQGMISFLKTA